MKTIIQQRPADAVVIDTMTLERQALYEASTAISAAYLLLININEESTIKKKGIIRIIPDVHGYSNKEWNRGRRRRQ